MTSVKLALRMLRRGWHSGEMRILFLALLIAVAGISAVDAFTDRVHSALERQASDLLGADLLLQSDHALEADYAELAAAHGLTVDYKTEFPSVASAAERLQLAGVKAVGPGYPLRGTVRISDRVGGDERKLQHGPGSGEAWADVRLISQLGIAVGEAIQLGKTSFTLTAVLLQEPDQSSGLAAFAPRLMIAIDDLPATELLQRGSRARYALLVAGEPAALARFRAAVRPLLQADQSVQDVKQARPQIAIALQRAERFLALAALVSVILAGVAIVSASRRYLAHHLDDCALLRCLGASYRTIVAVMAGQLLLVAIAGCVAGVMLGYTVQFLLTATVAPLVASELPLPGLVPAISAFFIGLLLLIAFALPTLLHLRQVPALRVLRRELGDLGPQRLGLYALGFAVIVLLMLWQAGDVRLVAYVVIGVAIALLLLYGAARLAVHVLRRLPLPHGQGWRLGLRAMAQRPLDSAVQLSACGIGLMALLLFALMRNDLINQWRDSLPADAPNRFLINVQPQQVDEVDAIFDRHGVTRPALYPAVRGRLVAINGKDARNADVDGDAEDESAARGGRVPGRSLNLSWAVEPPPHNVLVKGDWWSPADGGLVSLEQDFSRRLGVGIGDRIRVDVAGVEIEARVANLREVEWDSFKINFYMIFSPDLLQAQPATLISAYHQPPAKDGLLRELLAQLPNVTVIDVDSILRQVKDIIDRVTRAVEYVFLFTLGAGLLVLFAAIHSTLDQRIRHAALMRALGASRRQLRQAGFAEFVGLGTLAGIIAATVATAVASVVASVLFELSIIINPMVWLWGIALGAVLVSVVGYSATRHILQQPPWQVLRGLE